MSETKKSAITQPLTPQETTDGLVRVVDPPEVAMELTADAAEISGLRLLEESDKARRRLAPPERTRS